jgi:hypothetical protein
MTQHLTPLLHGMTHPSAMKRDGEGRSDAIIVIDEPSETPKDAPQFTAVLHDDNGASMQTCHEYTHTTQHTAESWFSAPAQSPTLQNKCLRYLAVYSQATWFWRLLQAGNRENGRQMQGLQETQALVL